MLLVFTPAAALTPGPSVARDWERCRAGGGGRLGGPRARLSASMASALGLDLAGTGRSPSV
jgi:hypothetical protein